MSDATTALAEVLNRHSESRSGHDAKATQIVTVCACGEEIGRDLKSYDLRHRAIEAHQAAAVVAAVRGLSPDLQAELIGGEVEHRRKLLELIDRPDKPMAFRMQDIARVVGPWTPEQAEETS